MLNFKLLTAKRIVSILIVITATKLSYLMKISHSIRILQDLTLTFSRAQEKEALPKILAINNGCKGLIINHTIKSIQLSTKMTR